MNGYKVFYNGREAEVYADSAYAAQKKAVKLFKVRKYQRHMVSVVLCEKDSKQVLHSTVEI